MGRSGEEDNNDDDDENRTCIGIISNANSFLLRFEPQKRCNRSKYFLPDVSET